MLKAETSLALYVWSIFFLFYFFQGITCEVLEKGGMGIYGFSAAKGFAYGLFFGTLVAILTYLIIVFFKRKVARTRDVTGGKWEHIAGF